MCCYQSLCFVMLYFYNLKISVVFAIMQHICMYINNYGRFSMKWSLYCFELWLHTSNESETHIELLMQYYFHFALPLCQSLSRHTLLCLQVYHLQPLFNDPDKNREMVLHESDVRARWPPDTALGFFVIATFCLESKPKKRPPMDQVSAL